MYQFWVHTSAVGKLPAIVEYVMVTPSHHRVHHARNPQYIDRNYGGNFIIWDRLFGTFCAEREEPVYGLVHPIQSFHPLVVQFSHLGHVLGAACKARGVRNALRVLLFSPSYNLATGSNEAAPPVEPNPAPYGPEMRLPLRQWVAWTFVGAVASTLAFLRLAKTLSLLYRWGFAALIMARLSHIGAVTSGEPLSPLWNGLLLLGEAAVTALLLGPVAACARLALDAFAAHRAATLPTLTKTPPD